MAISLNSSKGFTLVELAIVMIIVGLLISGVLKGQQLIKNAQIAAVITQVKGYQAAINSFRDAYGGMAGDMSNADRRLSGCDAVNYCQPGDGDSLVGFFGSALTANAVSEEETIQFWKHLALADLITGGNPSAEVNTTDLAWGLTHPDTPVAGGFEFFFSTNLGYGTTSGHVLRLTNGGVTGVMPDQPGEGAMAPRDAAQIERKLDDGQPSTGIVRVWDVGNNGCDNMLDGSPGIDETVKRQSCMLLFLIDG